MEKNYHSTRSNKIKVSASRGILQGLAADGGLFVPDFIDKLQLSPALFKDKNYGDMTAAIFQSFLNDFTKDQITDAIDAAYYTGKFENQEPVELRKIGNSYFLELFHGPTCAFKDMALTILPYLMVESMKNVNLKKKIMILTATSGDTGKAALEGFSDVDNISIIVFYPKDGVSTIQEKQMLTQTGKNTAVIGVEGNFDDTQNGVKKLLNDQEIISQLNQFDFIFSSANSINIGRLLPQIVYYFYSYYDLLKRKEITEGETINFVVPTGNFGNILAGYYAKRLGLPVHKLICASNSNNVLTDFLNSGTYNKKRNFHKTISPSMDILISSNLERLLYDLYDCDSQAIDQLMKELQSAGQYTVSDAVLAKLDFFYGGFASEAETKKNIQATYEEFNYLIDPHTAVANCVYDTYKKSTKDDHKTIILSTASPFKFGRAVYESIFASSPLDDYALLNVLAQKTGTQIPQPLRDLNLQKNHHHRQCKSSQMPDAVLDFVRKQVNTND